jgi:hypothetical protein
MKTKISWVMTLLLSFSLAIAEEEAEQTETDATPEEEPQAPEDKGLKKMSGMSILGNEETPKSLVIVPWKSSEMGDDIGLTDTLDDRAQPVDKEVFLRELEYFEIRSGE